MSRTVFLPILVIIVLFLCACQPIQAPPDMQAEVAPTPTPMVIEKMSEVPRIALEDAKEHFDNGTAIFVDSRDENEYAEAHIANAIHVTATMMREHERAGTLDNKLPKDQLIITYCT